MRNLKSALVGLVAAIVSTAAFAQSDPKLTSTVDADPLEVTLSRNLSSPTEFVGRAAYRVKVKNGAANTLNRASFTAQTLVVNPTTDDPVPGANAFFDLYIAVSGKDPLCQITTTSLSCNFGDSQLASGEDSEFILVVKAPTTGGRIKLHWTFGGDEGNGGGNGCCTKVADTYTGLIDAAAANSTVKTHVQSFMVKNVLNKVFTGISGGAATSADPWTTVADLGAGYIERGYTKATIDERDTSNLGSCSALNKNQCWLSDVTIPDTTWPTISPLRITLQRHSSIIKNGSKLSNYVIQYSSTPTNPGSFTTIPSCTPGEPTLPRTHCVEPCVEIPLATTPPTFVWSCTIRALHNGGYRSP
jgi:hypothetical protein